MDIVDFLGLGEERLAVVAEFRAYAHRVVGAIKEAFCLPVGFDGIALCLPATLSATAVLDLLAEGVREGFAGAFHGKAVHLASGLAQVAPAQVGSAGSDRTAIEAYLLTTIRSPNPPSVFMTARSSASLDTARERLTEDGVLGERSSRAPRIKGDPGMNSATVYRFDIDLGPLSTLPAG